MKVTPASERRDALVGLAVRSSPGLRAPATLFCRSAHAALIFKNGGQTIELIETITERNLPVEFSGHYEWAGGRNTLRNRFFEVGPNRTWWESTCTYEFRSVVLKLIGFFAPGLFRRQNRRFLENFKAFCEKGHDVREPRRN